MAIKKSDLYSSLRATCNELRGGTEASQHNDYVLFLLFIKNISDKYGNSDNFDRLVTIPKWASFKGMIALHGKHILRGVLGRIAIELPPIREQTALTTVLSDMNAELSALTARRDKARDLKDVTMRELLTGRTHLL
jgi:hypothetical protein